MTKTGKLQFHWLIGMVSALLIGTGMISGTSVLAKRTLYWDRIDVELELTQEGNLHVTEHLYYVFDGAWNGGFRKLPYSGVEDYRNISLEEEGYGKYREGNLSRKRHYQITRKRDGVFIKWRSRNVVDPPYRMETVHFILRYTALGVVRKHHDTNRIVWNCIFPERPGKVNHSTVELKLPFQARDPRMVHVSLATYARESEVKFIPPDRVRAVASDLFPGDAMQLQVQFPAGLVKSSFHWRHFARTASPFWLFLVFLGIGLFAHFYRFIGHGLDPSPLHRIEYLPRLPESITPALAGALDSHVGMPEILGTILDLARRGYLRLREEESSSFLGLINRKTVTIERLKGGDEELADYEKKVLKGLKLKEAGDSVNVEDLKNKFYKTIPKFVKSVNREMVRRGWYIENPKASRTKHVMFTIWLGVMMVLLISPLDIDQGFHKVHMGVGLVCIFVGLYTLFKQRRKKKSWMFIISWMVGGLLISGWNLTGILQPVSLVLPMVSIIITVLAGLLVAPFMPRRTRKGAQVYEQVQAFKRYLKHLQLLSRLEEAKDKLEILLPYTTALGMEKWFLNQLETLGDVPSPGWYMFMDNTGRSYSGGGVGSGTGMISLQKLSDSLASSLSSLSSTLGSSPSGGGSGGFSGGAGGGGGSGGGGGGGW